MSRLLLAGGEATCDAGFGRWCREWDGGEHVCADEQGHEYQHECLCGEEWPGAVEVQV